MVKEISCPEENLENFILYGEQIPYYKFIHGEPDKRKVDKKTRDYYHKGKEYAEQFKD